MLDFCLKATENASQLKYNHKPNSIILIYTVFTWNKLDSNRALLKVGLKIQIYEVFITSIKLQMQVSHQVSGN